MELCSEALFYELVTDLAPYLSRVSDGIRGYYPGVPELPPDSSLNTVRAHALLHSFYKKLADDELPDARDKALELYLSFNERCRSYEGPEFRTEYERELWGTFKSEVHHFFNSGALQSSIFEQSLFEDRETCVGPGASIASRGYDYYTKVYDGPLSSTSMELYSLYRQYRAIHYSTPDTPELLRNDRYGVCIVPGERLDFVPKTRHIARTIGIQPFLNMFFQKMLGNCIERELRSKFQIDLSDQPDFNRTLARLGSLGRGFDTIDLKGASDSISPRLLQLILDPSTYGWLDAVRCKSVSLPNGELYELGLFSAMGNGFTFPLQTALFACMVRAAYRLRDIPASCRPAATLETNPATRRGLVCNLDAPTYGVFGDDIVCRREATRDILRLLELCGFVANPDKTFVEGPFRESCGHDYYNGNQVRGVYVKSLLSRQSRCVAFNRLLLWSLKSNIRLDRTLSYLQKWCKGSPLVPLWQSDDAGLKIPLSLLLDRAGTDGVARDSNGALLYMHWENQSKKLRVLEEEIASPRGFKPRLYNAQGVLDSLLSGTLRGGFIVLRNPSETRYRLTRRRTPNWDFPSQEFKLPRPVVIDYDLWRGQDFFESWVSVCTRSWGLCPQEIHDLVAMYPPLT